jgi:hypothetical protein
MGARLYNPLTGEVFEEDDAISDGIEPSDPDTPSFLTVDEATDLLGKAHKVFVGPDDPLLMLVTLQQRFGQDLQTVLSTHDKAIEAAIKSTAGSTVQAVNQALETLKDKTVLAGLNHAMALVKEQAVAMDRFERVTRRNLWITAALNISSWLVFLIGGGVLWVVLR